MIDELMNLYKACTNKDNQMGNKDGCYFPQSSIFGETWLLRVSLQKMNDEQIIKKLKGFNPDKFKFLPFPENKKIYSEGSLEPPFGKGSSKDAYTQADGIIGNFTIGDNTKSKIVLNADFEYFVVFEAKMYSGVSRGIKNHPSYSQAARTIACMINMIIDSDKNNSVENLLKAIKDKKIFFIIIHPTKTKSGKLIDFTNTLKRETIEYQIETRTHEKDTNLVFKNNWKEIFKTIEIIDLTWEDIVDKIDDEKYLEFYELCKNFNGRIKKD